MHVAEFQGLYGPFTLSERVVQKIWLRQDFATTDLKTASGKKLVIKDPGRWNFCEGPDFKEAKLVLDGLEVVGDVEVHFNLLDWRRHQHEKDKNYDRVLLHVVLYQDKADQAVQVQTSQGHVPELLYLLPLMEQDLESYAMEDALLELERNNELEWVARFIGRPFEERLQILQKRALMRWQQKLAYAKKRLEAEGWEAACHSYALEVLGYKRNRAPMLRLATQYSLAKMRKDFGRNRKSKIEEAALNKMGNATLIRQFGNADSKTLAADLLFDEEAAYWKLNGLRPMNHPRRRLAQYLEIVEQNPQWPDQLADCLQTFPDSSGESETAVFRKVVGLSSLRKKLSESVFCSVIGQGRFNTLTVDAILPMATAAGLLDGVDYWLHWFPGDSPEILQHFLRRAGVITRQNPKSNGLNQGALALFFERVIE